MSAESDMVLTIGLTFQAQGVEARLFASAEDLVAFGDVSDEEQETRYQHGLAAIQGLVPAKALPCRSCPVMRISS